LVPILGKKTGWDETYSKQNECAKELRSEKGWESISGGDIEKETTFEVLPSCASTSRSSSGESQTDLIMV
jgi:hypothetical protein